MKNLFYTLIDDGYGTMIYQFTPLGYFAIVVIIALLLFSCSFLFTRKQREISHRFNIKKLVFSSAAIALSTVTSFIKPLPFELPFGGSVTLLSMFFVCLVGWMFGLKTGLMAAFAHGLLQLVIEPYVISIPQMLTDYLFAFGTLGLSGIFHNRKHGLIKGYITGILGRFVFAYLSGLIFFASYAADYNLAPEIYSFLYNGSYIGLEAVITVILIALPPVSNALKQIKRISQE